jgi:hypothetical protein
MQSARIPQYELPEFTTDVAMPRRRACARPASIGTAYASVWPSNRGVYPHTIVCHIGSRQYRRVCLDCRRNYIYRKR